VNKTLFLKSRQNFFFKLYNNTLGYNNAVAHFVQGHTPYCSFCDLTRSPDQNNETPLHLFLECRSVCDVLETVLKTVTGTDNFVFSRREYFTTFERREASYAYNQTLTLVTKIIIKYVWDCKTRFYLPNVESCLDNICDKIKLQFEINSSLSNITVKSGLPFFVGENFVNNAFP
jgi:hypothetical protein